MKIFLNSEKGAKYNSIFSKGLSDSMIQKIHNFVSFAFFLLHLSMSRSLIPFPFHWVFLKSFKFGRPGFVLWSEYCKKPGGARVCER